MASLQVFAEQLFFALCSAIVYGLLFVVLYYVSKFLWRNFLIYKSKDPSSKLSDLLPLPPGDFGIPFLGETLLWAIQGNKFNFLRRKKYGKVFSTHFLGSPVIKVTGPEYVRKILTGEHDIVTTIWPSSVRRILGGTCIINSIGISHKNKRRLCSKAFSHSALNSYVPKIREEVLKQISTWRGSCYPTKIYEELKKLTFSISAKILVGLNFETIEERDEMFEIFDEMINNLMTLPLNMPGSGLRKGLKCRDRLHEMLDEPIKKKQKRLECNGNDGSVEQEEYTDALQYMMEAEMEELQKFKSKDSDSDSDRSSCSSSDEEEVRCSTIQEHKEAMVELLFAGYQTTSSSISSMFIQLAKHHDVREKLEAELIENGLMNPDGTATTKNIDLETIQKLSYMEQVFKEIMRLMPPVLGGYRKAKKTFQIGDYRVPKDWTIIYNIRDTHEAEWENYSEFDPERFSPENWDRANGRFRWIPFGGGSRVCLGKELGRLQVKIVMIEALRAFSSWQLENNKYPPLFPLPTLHPTNGLPIIFSTR